MDGDRQEVVVGLAAAFSAEQPWNLDERLVDRGWRIGSRALLLAAGRHHLRAGTQIGVQWRGTARQCRRIDARRFEAGARGRAEQLRTRPLGGRGSFTVTKVP